MIGGEGTRHTAEQHGRNLRLTRERRGLSKRTVAKALGVTQSAFAKVENGSHVLSSDEKEKLAEIYGCSEYALRRPGDEPHMVDLSASLHRTLPMLRHEKDIESAIMRVIHACDEGMRILRLMGNPEPPKIPKSPARIAGTADAIRQGEAAASKERTRLGLGAAPLGNIAGLLNNEGVWSVATRLPDDLSGLFLCHPTVGTVVLVNVVQPPGRRNFSYAHEYAHAIFDRDNTVTATRRAGRSDPGEKRANAFAAAFLMPPDGVVAQLDRMGKGIPSRKGTAGSGAEHVAPDDAENAPRPDPHIITPHDIATIARHFCVSQEAMARRLQNLGHITPSERKSLLECANLGQEYVNLLDPRGSEQADSRQDSGEMDFRYRLMHLALEAFRLEKITGGRLREAARKLSLSYDLWNLALEMFDAE